MISRRGLLGLGGITLVAGCVPDAPPATTTAGDWHGTHLADGGNPLPDVTLIDQFGQPYNLATGPTTRAVALFFGYTNCPDVCPGILADMATAKRRLPAEMVDDVTLIVVTTDPARDTPEVLKEYLVRVDDSFVGLTGDLETIKPAAMSLGIDISEGKQLPSGGYEVDHGSYVMGFGEDRRLAVVWSQIAPADLKEDFERLLAA
ncbi:SCO family protein [Tessaracoccus defluvii]|uniref:SCO family protein n=1 Tax=Tessaracoccus defluvii TaxID=1285901 RepID=A0A7H0H840_9ACTN|nr:SCO family protein [Tessaracoccus defluvii]QNP56706.1 SCO family protein [Tessaracoccus defluvii]